jgi:hypothetical protein
VTVAYKTKDATAIAGSDYTSTSGTLSLAAGETFKTINVSINGDAIVETDETFKLSLSNVVNATISKTTATGTIQNDDAAFAQEANNFVAKNIQSGIKIFPNPVTNNFLQVTMNSPLTTSCKLMIYDANGSLVKLEFITVNTASIKLDVKEVKSGNYFIVISDGKQLNFKEKIVVIH